MAKNKSLFVAAGIVVFLIGGGFLFLQSGRDRKMDVPKGSQPVLGEDIALYMYSYGNTLTDSGVISIPFLAETKGARFLNVAVDLNADGAIAAYAADGATQEEWLVRNVEPRALRDYRNNFSFQVVASSMLSGSPFMVHVALTTQMVSVGWNGAIREGEGEIKMRKARVARHDLGDLLGLNVPGASEELKRGSALPMLRRGKFATPVFAAESPGQFPQPGSRGDIDVFRGGNTPDLPQGNMECTAVSAANNIISLAGEHSGLEDLNRGLPAGTRGMVEQLKQDMQFNNGILLRNIVAGKDAFARRHNLPIVSERIDAPTFEDIADALERGAAVELSMSWVQSASGHPNTGHVVSAVGATGDASGQSIQVHDPATPEGMDALEVTSEVRGRTRSYMGVDYPGWDGVAYIDAIFVQRWVAPQQGESSTTAPPQDQSAGGTSTGQDSAPENIIFVEMLVFGDGYYPLRQFKVAAPDACGAEHYHVEGGIAYGLARGLTPGVSTQVIEARDPNPPGCGFGKVGEIPVETAPLTFEQQQQLIRFLWFQGDTR